MGGIRAVGEAAATAVATADFDMDLAQDETPSVDANKDWEVAFTPYLWVAGISGNVSIPRRQDEIDVDRSFSDILGDLKFAFMGTLDVNYRRFVMHADTIYLNLGADVERVDSLIFQEGEFDAHGLLTGDALTSP